MSYLNTKQALINLLLDTNIPNDNMEFENKSFNPFSKDFYISVSLLPASTEMMGKTTESGDEQRGIFQISVYIKRDVDSYDNDQLGYIDDILSVFKYNTKTEFESQVVSILSSEVSAGLYNDSWFKRDVSINYLTFSKR